MVDLWNFSLENLYIVDYCDGKILEIKKIRPWFPPFNSHTLTAEQIFNCFIEMCGQANQE